MAGVPGRGKTKVLWRAPRPSGITFTKGTDPGGSIAMGTFDESIYKRSESQGHVGIKDTLITVVNVDVLGAPDDEHEFIVSFGKVKVEEDSTLSPA